MKKDTRGGVGGVVGSEAKWGVRNRVKGRPRAGSGERELQRSRPVKEA